MRVDVFLHKVCVLKSRTLAKEACDRGKVRVNDAPAKAAHEVRAGDRIRLDLGARMMELRVLEIPVRAVPKKDAGRYVETIRDLRLEA